MGDLHGVMAAGWFASFAGMVSHVYGARVAGWWPHDGATYYMVLGALLVLSVQATVAYLTEEE